MTAGCDLAAALASSEFAHGEHEGFWRLVKRAGDVLYVEVIARDETAYVLELQCDRYGVEPIRGRFVDAETLACIADAWPRGNRTFGGWFKWDPRHLFICWPADRGGLEHHTDWRALEHWRKTDNPLVQYLEFIRQCLMLPARGYQPRVQPVAC